MKIHSFAIKDDNNVRYLDSDLSQLLDNSFLDSRKYIKGIEIKEVGKKFKIILLLSLDYGVEFVSFTFRMQSFSDIYFSLEVGSEHIRVENKVQRVAPEDIQKMFGLVDKVLSSYCEKSNQYKKSLFELSNFKKALDAATRYILY